MSLRLEAIYGGPIIQTVHLIYVFFKKEFELHRKRGREVGGAEENPPGSLSFMNSHYLASLDWSLAMCS